MPFPPEVNVFKAEVGRYQGLVTPGQVDDSAIVANANAPDWMSSSPAYFRNQLGFYERHSEVRLTELPAHYIGYATKTFCRAAIDQALLKAAVSDSGPATSGGWYETKDSVLDGFADPPPVSLVMSLAHSKELM